MTTLQQRQQIVIDGLFLDWLPYQQIDYGDVSGFTLYEQTQGGNFNFALTTNAVIGPTTTFWFNTDQNAATGYQIFGFAGGAEYNVEIRADGTAGLYTGAAGETLVLDNIPIAYSSDHMSVEFSVPKLALGGPAVIDVLYDVNNTLFGPSNYSAQPYIAFGTEIERTDFTHRIGIVFSATTAKNFFSATAYSQLFMTMQSQAMQAGISFDILTEADLTNAAKLANYDALVFPSFANVPASQVQAITDALLQVTKQFGVGLITAGNFMTNDENGNPLPGDSYARMKLLFDATRVTGGFPADVTLTATDAAPSVFGTLAPGEVIHNYSQVAWDAFQSVSGTGQVLATETVGGQTYAAALATQTGGHNVLFSTAGVMADNNLLWQAIDHVAKDPGIQVSLDLTRSKGIVVSRTDMDISKLSYAVSPSDGSPGIYDLLLPILAQWKAAYNFVGSYYVNIGNDIPNEEYTNWAVSAPYYAQILAMGNEIGTHSYTHPFDTNTLTPAQIQFEFQQSAQVIDQQMSAYLGTPFRVAGAAVPGAPETLTTAQRIIQYFDYMSGGYSGVGAGYPGAFGFLTPDYTNAVYLAPNTSFDFSLVEYQKLGVDGAAAAWNAEWNQLVDNAQTPIVLWPWHDYAATTISEDPGVPSPYTTQLFTDWIARAYNSGAEFVTADDLAQRIQSFYASGVTSTVNGNVIDVTVASPHAGDFALNLSNLGSDVISSVAGWYAYDGDSLFLPEAGGSFSITTGATAADLTHIVALPMRADLLSVTGDGLNLGFSLIGEGHVMVDLGDIGNLVPVVTGASIAGLSNGTLDISLGSIGLHSVNLSFGSPGPAERVTGVAFSADTGASASDFITMTAAQTITGALSAALAAGDVVRLSLDNGVTWLTATATEGATSFSLQEVLPAGANTLLAQVENAQGTPSTALSQAYALDQKPPAAPGLPALAPGSDTGSAAADGITNLAMPTIQGADAEPGGMVTLRDGATVLGTAIADADSAWHITPATPLADGVYNLTATVTDLAGNTGPASASFTIAIDTTAPAAPSTPDLLPASDSGASSGDNITNVVAPSFRGTAEGLSTVTLFDGTIAIGTGQAAANGSWSIAVAGPLADGTHLISATATDIAGNTSLASGALSLTIATAAQAPSAPAMTAATDKGASNTDGITNDATPTFTGTAAPGSTVTLFDGAAAVGTGKANASGVWTVTATKLADGSHQIAAQAKDLAGNLSALSPASTAVIDTAPPAAPGMPALAAGSDTGISATDNITRLTTPTFTGTAEAGATVTLYNGTSRVGTGVAGADGVWTITASSLAAGVRSITARAADVAGNQSAASATLFVTVDTSVAAPSRPDLVAASDSGRSSTDNITNLTAARFSGTAEAGSLVTLFDGGVAVGSAVAAADKSWTAVAELTGDGVHTIGAQAVDVAGNVSALSGTLAVTLDTATPAAPQFVSGSLTRLNGSGEAGSSIVLLDGGATLGTANVGSAGNWSISFIAGTTPRLLTAYQVDAAGNVGALATGAAVLGTAGADTLAGTAGDDLFIGGNGADVFSFAAGFGNDLIADFVATGSAHDVVNFHAIAGLASYADVLGHASATATGVVIGLDAGQSLTLAKASLATLTASDFTFV